MREEDEGLGGGGVGGSGKSARGREKEGLSVACLCLMEVPGVALGLLHFTINGGALWGTPCSSITPTHTLTHTQQQTCRLKLNSASLCPSPEWRRAAGAACRGRRPGSVGAWAGDGIEERGADPSRGGVPPVPPCLDQQNASEL